MTDNEQKMLSQHESNDQTASSTSSKDASYDVHAIHPLCYCNLSPDADDKAQPAGGSVGSCESCLSSYPERDGASKGQFRCLNSKPKKESEPNYQKPIVMLASVKGGSGKTYSALSLAFTLTHYLNKRLAEDHKDSMGTKRIFPPRVCVIDLDLSATNMRSLLTTLMDEFRGDPTTSLRTKQSIHEYLVATPRQSSCLEDYISRLTYMSDMSGIIYDQIDFILGSSDPKWMRLFSQSRISSYENSVSEPEARTLLHKLLDEVLRRKYDAVIIDMQPGMEGLCHAAIEYFTSTCGNEHYKEGFYDKAVKGLYKQYTTNLCFTSTSDWTQLCGNMNWMLSQLALCQRVEKKHVLIKDNLKLIEKNIKNGTFSMKQLFKQRIPEAIKTTLIGGVNPIEKMIQSAAVLRNNDNYVNFFCNSRFFNIPDPYSSNTPNLPEYFCVSDNPGEPFELTEWIVDCLLH